MCSMLCDTQSLSLIHGQQDMTASQMGLGIVERADDVTSVCHEVCKEAGSHQLVLDHTTQSLC